MSNLSVATRKFHLDNVLGQGGSSTVFKGWADENTFAAAKWGTGMAIAVKRFKIESLRLEEECLTEINTLGELCHPNIVKLIGYCIHKKHRRLLVYEYMPLGSLHTHLFMRDSDVQPLSWKLRLSIALGLAKGLAYLHSPEVNVIHRDIKLSNILIDSNYNAKLGDFGFAEDGPEREETYVSTVVKGTFGYLDPEYFRTSHLTMKSDVYSFGVVLLEILTGRKAVDRRIPGEDGLQLVRWAESHLRKEHVISDIMDADIKGQYTEGAASKAFSLALKCTSFKSKSRPDAKQVVEELEKLLDL